MSMSPDTPDRDEDLPELLDDLEATLTDLRAELSQETESNRRREAPTRLPRRDRPGSGSGLPRPPSVADLFRFTEEYTLPTLIATLEATIRALELLRGTLRLVDPGRSAFESPAGQRDASSVSRLGSGAAGVGREAVSSVERALSELEAALADSNVPDDRASDELLGDARDLSAEVRERLEAAQGSGTTGRAERETGAPSGREAAEPGADGVRIEVIDDAGAGNDDDGRGDEDRPEVDVEAELESIRHDVRGPEDPDPTDGDAESAGDEAQSQESEDGSGGDGGRADDEGSTPADEGADTAGTGDDPSA